MRSGFVGQEGRKKGEPAIAGRPWYFMADVGPDGGPRRQMKRRGFPTKKAAERALREALNAVDEHRWVEPSRETFGDYLHRWLELQGSQLRATSLESYRRHLEAHVIERDPAGRFLRTIANTNLQRVTPGQLNDLYRELVVAGRRRGSGPAGLSVRTVRYVHSIIRKALEDALQEQRVTVNVAKAAKPPKATAASSPETAVWDGAQVGQFLAHVADHRLSALWRLMAFTGMRRGEALGLRWGDIDGEHKRLSVVQTVVPVNGRSVVGKAKTDGSVRTIDVDDGTLAALKAHRARQAHERLQVGPGYRDGGLVFANPHGEPLNPVSITATFGRLVGTSDLPRIRLHDLRHSHASILLAEGVPVKVVTERLGHSSPSFTMSRYQKVLPGMQASAAQQFASLVDGRRP